MLLTITFALILAVLAVVLIVQFRGKGFGGFGARSAGAGFVQGTLTVTGVSERPDADSKGQAFCTVSGTIVGPGTNPADVYGTMILTEGQPWPQMADQYPVVYKPGKAETSWQFGELPPQVNLDKDQPPM